MGAALLPTFLFVDCTIFSMVCSSGSSGQVKGVIVSSSISEHLSGNACSTKTEFDINSKQVALDSSLSRLQSTQRDKKYVLWSYFAFAKTVTFSKIEKGQGRRNSPQNNKDNEENVALIFVEYFSYYCGAFQLEMNINYCHATISEIVRKVG